MCTTVGSILPSLEMGAEYLLTALPCTACRAPHRSYCRPTAWSSSLMRDEDGRTTEPDRPRLSGPFAGRDYGFRARRTQPSLRRRGTCCAAAPRNDNQSHSVLDRSAGMTADGLGGPPPVQGP